jgi:hypothetical protein
MLIAAADVATAVAEVAIDIPLAIVGDAVVDIAIPDIEAIVASGIDSLGTDVKVLGQVCL